jgi:hypothetical protein
MQIQRFKNYISYLHETWMGNTLGMDLNPIKNGIDLIDSRKGIEIKSCLIIPNSPDHRRRYAKWTAFDGQWDYDCEYQLPLFWALGSYNLDMPVSRIRTTNPKKLEEHVSQRNFWIIPWEWGKQFQTHPGKQHDYRYLRLFPTESSGLASIPPVFKTIKSSGGQIHFTKGVNLRLF